jgi:heptosyltransferase-2
MIIRYNCRHLLGHKPCKFRRVCEDCPDYAAVGKRILIIKLAAMGDVLRTTPLLHGLRAKDPACEITWITESHVMPMLRGIKEIDRLLPFDYETVLQMEMEAFDEVYCFDKEPKATALAMKVPAELKAGFGLNRLGKVIPLNRESEYTYRLGIDDSLKFRLNAKSYPELIYECAGMPCTEPKEYILPDFSAEIAEARDYLHAQGVKPGDLLVGLNTGSGDVFATKKWTEAGYAELADRMANELGARILLLGGPAEVERNRRIAAAVQVPVLNTGNDHPIRKFSGIVGNCDLLITGDTLAMHIAIGMKVPVLVIFGSTCHQEIELYGRGAKVVSDFECSPCYLSVCPKPTSCMDALSAETVFESAVGLIGNHRHTIDD